MEVIHASAARGRFRWGPGSMGPGQGFSQDKLGRPSALTYKISTRQIRSNDGWICMYPYRRECEREWESKIKRPSGIMERSGHTAINNGKCGGE